MSKNLPKNKYQCAICGGIFNKIRSDEEANKEAEEIWGVENASESDEMVRICDDCFNRRTPEEIEKMGKEYKSINK